MYMYNIIPLHTYTHTLHIDHDALQSLEDVNHERAIDLLKAAQGTCAFLNNSIPIVYINSYESHWVVKESTTTMYM